MRVVAEVDVDLVGDIVVMGSCGFAIEFCGLSDSRLRPQILACSERQAIDHCPHHHTKPTLHSQSYDTMFVRRVALSVARSTPARAPIAARTFTSSVVRRKSPPRAISKLQQGPGIHRLMRNRRCKGQA